ncbi:hypothetical protein TrRE_jg3927, partial [Triparma retinervis]
MPGIFIYLWCSAILLFVTGMTIYYTFKNAPTEGEKLHPSVAPPIPSPSSERLYYLDNLKVFLTAVVIIHHQTCSFVGNGWYYKFGNYTNLFQIVIFEKKGKFNFLKDKFFRLGVPYIVFSFALSFLLQVVYNSP